MEYSIQKLSKMAGVSTRTLRYYDEIGLLKPIRTSASGYRIYGTNEVDTLQHILFYRELGVELKEIEKLLYAEDFDQLISLKEHLSALLARKERLNQLIETVNKTIWKEQGKLQMKDNEKFLGFKNQRIEENEKKYGAEIRSKYGEETVDQSNEKLLGLSAEEYSAMTDLGEKIKKELLTAVKAAEAPDGEHGLQIASWHRKWLSYSWPEYTPQAHKNLGEMYTADPRFTAYYDDEQEGCAAFLRDAIAAYVVSPAVVND